MVGARLTAACLLLVCLLLPLACGRSGHSDALARRMQAGVIVYNLANEPTTLDPARASRLSDLRTVGQLLDGLVRIGPDGRVEPAAATSWTIAPDGRTYTFRLRQARWSNGDPVRAGDFAFAWRRVLDPATRGIFANLLFGIEGAEPYFKAAPEARAGIRLGIETPDDRTLVVRLAQPVSYFLSLVALETCFPVHPPTVTRLGEAAFAAPHYIGNGPFRLVEHIPRRRIVLEPNPLHAEAGAGPQRLIFVMVENEFTEWTAYRRGELDVTATVHRSALATVRRRVDFRSVPLVGTCYLVFNCEQPPFDRAEVRRAFARALDRQLLVQHITRGGEQPATAFVPPGILYPLWRGDFRREGGDLLPPTAPDDAEMQRLRAAMGALPGPIDYAFDTSDLMRSLAIALQMTWRERLGVEVGIQAQPARVLAQRKRAGDFQIARASWIADYLDATTFLDLFRGDSPQNVTRWRDPRYDALLDRAAAAADPAARIDLLHEAERLLMDEMPICPVFFYAIAYLERPGLEGIRRNLLGRVDFRRAHWSAPKE